MAQKLYEESNIQAIADAIRGKNGLTTTYKTSEMAAAISAIEGGGGGGVDIPDEAFVISGDCQNWDYAGKWDSFITAYANKWSTNDVAVMQYMFRGSSLKTIPFDINCRSSSAISLQNMFTECRLLKELPKINNLKMNASNYIFVNCERLRTIPEDYTDTWDWSYLKTQTNAYSGNQSSMFSGCKSLRSFPMNIIKNGNPYANYSYSYFYMGFKDCYVLDELNNLPIPYTSSEWKQNAFSSTFTNCLRLKNVIFATQEDGTPYVVKWKSQVIDLSSYVGYANSTGNILNHNSGITADKEVKDDATYQALKNDPDWFTLKYTYSRYNHDSAVATINTLPDTSAYLASAGGTNTIKFAGVLGSATDGGAINTLTEEEIAVATAKGWTVSLI